MRGRAAPPHPGIYRVPPPRGLREQKILIKSCIAGFHGDHLSTIKCNFGRKNKKVKNKNKHTCKKKNEATKGLCNNYLEGAGRVGKCLKYAPKLSHTPPLSLSKN